MIKKILITSLFTLGSMLLFSQTAEEIISKSRETMTVKSFEAYSTLKILDARGNERLRQSTMASRSYPDGSEKRVIRFTAPPEVSGTGILIYDNKDKQDDMWIYLPALRQTRRIVSSEKSKSFMGSEFSNADMTAPNTQDFSYRILGEKEIDGKTCWQIESVPKNRQLEDEYGYGKALTCINKVDYVVLLNEYYNFDGELFKTIATRAYTRVDAQKGRYMVTDMIANNLRNGRSSVMLMDKIQQTETDESYFTVSWLEKAP